MSESEVSHHETPQPEKTPFDDFETLVKLLHRESLLVGDDAIGFEATLQDKKVAENSLLSALEQAGIVQPRTEEPSPYDEDEKTVDESIQTLEDMEERRKALKYIAIGTVLGTLFGDRLNQNLPKPKSDQQEN